MDLVANSLGDEVFEGDNLYHCSICDKRVPRAVKSQSIASLPSYMIVTVNRFYFDRDTKRKEKICKPVQILPAIELQNCEYTLQSIVIHAGKSSNFGHYYTVARDIKNQWWILNDSEVSQISAIGPFLANLTS